MAKKFYRSRTDSMIAGVCGGLAEYFDIDSMLVRLGTFLLALTGGFGIIAYLIFWVIVPQKPIDESLAEEATTEGSGIETDEFKESKNSGALVGGGILVVIGFLFLLSNFIPYVWLSFRKLWPLILIIVGIMIITKGAGSRGDES